MEAREEDRFHEEILARPSLGQSLLQLERQHCIIPALATKPGEIHCFQREPAQLYQPSAGDLLHSLRKL